MERTQVGIIGAGPAGLVLGQLLHLHGIEAVVIEARSRHYVEHRTRAGVLEQGSVDLLDAAGVGERMHRQGFVHHGIELRFDGEGHRIDLSELTNGRSVMLYGQTEVVKDLIRARLDAELPLHFEAPVEHIEGLEGDRPVIHYRHEGEAHALECDFVAGCDGFHGVSRAGIPADKLRVHTCEHPFAWLGILAQVAPSCDELIYAYHDNGFALHSYRSHEISRIYVQVDPDEALEEWPDDRVWEELHTRMACDGWTLQEGPVLERTLFPMRSFVAEPMQHGRLFLAGDAAHVVQPSGAKGLNLALADVRLLAAALARWFRYRDTGSLETYSATALRRVWRAEHFSRWMTTMLHRFPDNSYEAGLQRSQLEYVCSSRAAATTLAENYVGLERV
jgi:p-hydroxybenzoate 3-monooxygenase